VSYRASPSYALGGILYDPEGLTNDVPAYGWRCFHCGEHFRPDQWLEARHHFGKCTVEPPLCQRALRYGREIVAWIDGLPSFVMDKRERPVPIDQAMRIFR
jgi:hypothetical protein